MADFLQPTGRGEGGAALVVSIEGVDESLRILTRAGAQLRGLDTGAVYMSNATLRRRARVLAETLARTTIAPLLMRGAAPQSRAMARTLRTRSDRRPVVAIGAVAPPLSGWRPGNPANRRRRGSLAWGVERGPHPAAARNYYGIPRRDSGYVIGPNLRLITARVAPQYRGIVLDALRAAGVDNIAGRAA